MPIASPNSDPTPKWARTILNAAKSRNRARGSPDVLFMMSDLLATWTACGGCCAVSGMAFDFEIVGNGQAKRPFAPSLDRIDPGQPYRRDNVRLVTAIANFGMNAWGLDPLCALASAVHRKQGDYLRPTTPISPDGDLDDIAATDADFVETDLGTVAFPPRPDMRQPILALLQDGPKSSRDIADALAQRFAVSPEMQSAMLNSGTTAWRNHVAWALVDLGLNKRGTGEIELIKKALGGRSMRTYRLSQHSS